MPKKLDILKVFRGRKAKDEKVLDTTPLEMPAGYRVPRPLSEFIAQMVKEAVQTEKKEDFETPEEADDFEADDDELLDLSPYELTELSDEEPLPKPVIRAEPQEAPQEENTPPAPEAEEVET